MKNVAALLLLLLAFAVGACEAFLDGLPASQCKANEDCRKFGNDVFCVTDVCTRADAGRDGGDQ